MIRSQTRFEALLQYIKETNSVPRKHTSYSYEGQDIQIGNFLYHLLYDNTYPKCRDEWFSQIALIYPQINDRLLFKKQYNKRIDPIIRFEALLQYIKETNTIPNKSVEYNYKGELIHIGDFLRSFTQNHCFKEYKEQWIEQLKAVSPNIRQYLEKPHGALELKLDVLIQYIKINKKLPIYSIIAQCGDQELKIGQFLADLLCTKKSCYKKVRANFIERLKAISPEISEMIERRMKN